MLINENSCQYSQTIFTEPDITSKRQETQSQTYKIILYKIIPHLPATCLDPEELSLSGLGFFFLCDPESEGACLFSTAGVDRALFLKSSRSLSRAGSILLSENKIDQNLRQ